MGDFSVGLTSKVIKSAVKFFVLFLCISELGFDLRDLLFVNVNLLGGFNLEFLDHLNFGLFSLSSDVFIFVL